MGNSFFNNKVDDKVQQRFWDTYNQANQGAASNYSQQEDGLENTSIFLDNLSGIYSEIAKKADKNGDQVLTGKEICIFDAAVKTIKNNSYIFNGRMFMIDSERIGLNTDAILEARSRNAVVQVADNTRVENHPTHRQIMDKQAQDLELEKASRYAQAVSAAEKDRITTYVVKSKTDKGRAFTYNKAALEDYIINDGTDIYGHKITYYKNIPDIRAKNPIDRTPEEQQKLNDFDTMVNCVIGAAKDYGVDPKYIVAIINREVNFDGMGRKRNVTGKYGKGYMQVTTITYKDFLGLNPNTNKYAKTDKNSVYGREMSELLLSRGFNIDCSPEEKANVVKEIEKYLTENKDPDFNIRLGTLILRVKLNGVNWNFQAAARNYNGKSTIKYAYAKQANEHYQKLANREDEYSA